MSPVLRRRIIRRSQWKALCRDMYAWPVTITTVDAERLLEELRALPPGLVYALDAAAESMCRALRVLAAPLSPPRP